MASFSESTIIDEEDYEVDIEYDTFYDSDDAIIYNYESETKSVNEETWLNVSNNDIAPVRHNTTAQSGLTQNISPQSKSIDYFYLFFTAELSNQIVLQTLIFMQKKKFRKKIEYTFNLALKWKNVTLDEMKALIGLNINMAIDESTVGYKGKISFKTYNPQKPRKWGLRVYVAAKSKLGYIFSFIPYYGKLTTDSLIRPDLPFTSRIVLSLFENIRIKYPDLKGMHIYTERFYTNALLAQELSLFKCHLTGTINPGRKGNCEEIKKPKISKGETLAYRKNNILLLSWKDKRIVTMCSSWHDSSVETIERHTKQGLEQIKKTSSCF
ncbi:hypothetical protein LAZ67_3005155 [Cordylochernes scorpioides]|uniref:PiggyBac transposable element-derived protein domain-containing protein n=1 Tax=Cordylochernes scorpioides TaxID=51811 RepID=A0ABY6KB33_9ARAC|nr:hypothetical protein LAZ67_3005155 [Cordylochernes scorpioides]